MKEDHDKPSISTGILLGEKYAVGRKIGDGGMGSVWEATHVEIGRKVAIKTLHKVERNRELALDRFRREAQMAGSIGHDNICEVTDIGTYHDGSPFLVMPLLQGSPLGDVLTGNKPMDPARVANVARQTLSALHAAHERGIVHRDLKPDNVFLTTFGEQTDVVKLLDFGICKLMDQDPVSSLTQSGTILGTPFYMAPEQAKGYRDLDHRVDVYAMGVIMYEALTGAPPFAGDSYNEIMFKIVEAPVPKPSLFSRKISPDLEQVVLKAMARNRDDRYVSAMEMRKALDKATGRVSSASMELNITAPSSQEKQDWLGEEGPNSSTQTVALETSEVVTSSQSNKPGGWIYGLLVVLGLMVAGALVYFLAWDKWDGDGAHDPTPAEPSAKPKITEPTPDKPKPQAEPALVAPVEDAGSSAVDASPPRPVEEHTQVESPPRQDAPPKKVRRPKKKVKGRFGTSILSEYDD